MAELRMYTLEEVASATKLTKKTIYKYVKNNNLHAVKFGKYWRVAEADLKTFMDKGVKVEN